MKANRFKLGDRVYWDDPDGGSCSGFGRIVSLQHDPPDEETVITLNMEDGGQAEVWPCELTIAFKPVVNFDAKGPIYEVFRP